MDPRDYESSWSSSVTNLVSSFILNEKYKKNYSFFCFKSNFSPKKEIKIEYAKALIMMYPQLRDDSISGYVSLNL
jgi:hypothetical protein